VLNIAMTNKYCALPFNHVNVNPRGDYQICCQHPVPAEHRKNIKFVSHAEWQNNQYLNEVRTSFEQGIEHPGCNACWQQEDLNLSSLRQIQAQEYRILGATPFQQKFLNVEISVGNLCNLSCIMCDEESSSAILSENQRLNISKSNQQDFAWSDSAFDHLEQILSLAPRVVNLRGGEPMYNKKILDIVNQFPKHHLKSTMLHLSTNATRWSDEWQNALKKFRLVRIMLSIDAVDSLFEYIRYPADFSQVEENIKKIASNSNIKPVIHATVQNLNVGSIGKLVQWAQYMNIHLIMDMLTYPAYLQITNLPDHLKKQAIDHLEETLSLELESHTRDSITQYKNILTNSLQSPGDHKLWQFFVDSILLRDNARGNSHKEFLKY
jgi:molybdenum cofactor biosynthesis enzyme MoaA